MNKKLLIIILMIIIAIGVAVWTSADTKNTNAEGNLKIVTSFYPMYIMTSNLVKNVLNVELVNMTEANAGCLHDYTISTLDMRKIEKADIYIQNGLGLENFMDKIVIAYPNLKIIDSSINIPNKLQEESINPHIWTSIENYTKQVETICEKLCEYDENNSDLYVQNYQEYLQKIDEKKLKYDTELQDLKGKKAVCLNEALTYLLEELKMEVIQLETNHEESTISADTLKDVITQMKNENIDIIVVNQNDNIKNAETLATETGAKIYKLDSGLTGEISSDAYLDMLEFNFLVLQTAI